MGKLETWITYGTVGLAPLSPGFTALFLLVPSASQSWRPLLDLSSLYESVLRTHFRMKSHHSVLRAVKRFAWMISIDLKDACLQVAIHLASRKCLRYVVAGMSFSFEICASVSYRPLLCSSGSVKFSSLGVRMLHYLAAWLILVFFRREALQARDLILQGCSPLGVC